MMLNKNKKIRALPNILLLIVLSVLLVFCFYDLWHYDFRIPLNYVDGDPLYVTAYIKDLGLFGQTLITPLLGAPIGATFYDFPVYGDSFHQLILIILYAFFKNAGIVENLFYILIFPATTVVSYFVMRQLKVHWLLADLGSLVYSFLPYHFLRNEMHLFLSAYTFVPLAVLILLWLLTDERLLRVGKGFFHYKKNYFVMLSLVIVALSGIYYAFFSCFFIFVAILILFLKSKATRNLKTVLKGIISLGIIGFSLLAVAMPTFVLLWQNGVNPQNPARPPSQAETYGMKIAQLFFPIKNHGIALLQKIQAEYATAPVVNEGTEYLGLIAIIGFLFALILLFYRFKKESERNEQLRFLAQLNLSAILLGTIGGFGSLFAFLVSPQIRCYNRISIFIGYFSILCLCIGLTMLLGGWKPKWRNIALVAFIPICLVSIHEQFIPLTVINDALLRATNVASFNSDDKFVKAIESEVGSSSMIYQLPYHPGPETYTVNKMGGGAHYRGYIHSDTLKWSYGDYKGRPADLWNIQTASEPVDQMIETISYAGFSGIYIDTYAYTADDLSKLCSQIEAVFHEKPMVSDDKRLLFYSMVNYNKAQKAGLTDAQWNQKREKALEIPPVWTTGFYLEEQDGFRWCKKEGAVDLYNSTKTVQSVDLRFTAASGYADFSTLTVTDGSAKNSYRINSVGETIELTLTLQPGENTIQFCTDSKKVNAPGDYRTLYFRIRDVEYCGY